MSDNDQNLTVSITADAADATANMGNVVDLLNRIEAELGSLATAQQATSGAAKEHAESESILGASLGKVEVATNAAARAFGALGLETGEATERVLMFTEALDALEASAGPLLVIGAAFLAIGAAVNFAREGIADAAQEQSEFIQMQAGIERAGGNWDDAKESIEKFATALQNATTFSRGEAITAIQSLTAAGISLSDSEKIVAVSTDIAAAKHRSLQDVVDTLKAAEAGRGRGLEELDVKTKTLVDSHARFSTVLEFLSKQFAGDAAAATETYEGKQARLRNELELLATEIGTMMLPMLSNMTQFFIGMTKSVEDSIASFMAFGRALSDIAKISNDIHTMNAGGIGGDLKSLGSDWAATQKSSDKSENEFFHPMVSGMPDMSAWNALRNAQNLGELDNDPQMGRTGSGRTRRAAGARDSGATGTPVAPLADDSLTSIDGETQSEKNLLAVLSALTAQQEPYKTAVELATDADEKRTAQLDQAKNAVADAQDAIRLITAENANLTAAVRTETAEEATHLSAVNSTRTAYDAYAAALGESGPKTAAQRAAVEALRKAHEDAVKAYDASVTSIQKLNGEIDKNNGLLDAQKQHLNDVNVLLAKQQFEENATFIKDFGDQLVAAVDAQNKFAAATQNAVDEESTYKKSLADQIAYFQARLAALDQADDTYAEESAKLQEKIQSLEVDEYKQRIDQHDAFVKSFDEGEDSMLNDVLTKHESFSDRMKSIWQLLLGDWEKMLEQMVLKSSILQGVNSEFFKIFSGGADAATAGGIASGSGLSATATGGGGFGGMLSSLIGSGGSQQQGVPSQLTDDSIQKLTGSTTGLADGSSGTTVYGPAGTYSDGGVDGTPSSFGDVFGGAFTSSGATAQSVFGDGMSGVAMGSLVAGVDGGNNTYASLLGGAGGIVGGIYGGPIGSEIGSVAGSLLGSFLGPHWGPASNYPDRSDTQRFGQTVADLQGTMGANGQTFYEDQTTKSDFSGKTGIAGVEELLASGNAATVEAETGLNPQQYAQAMSIFGASATGSGKLNFGTHIGTEWITGAKGSGSQFSYTDAGALLSEIEQGLGGSGSESIPTFNVTRTNQNPNLTKLSSTGSYLDSSALATNLLQSVAANDTNATNKTPTVTVTINGNVVGPGGMDSIATTIAKSLQRVNNGLIPGASVQPGGRTLVGQN